MDGGGWIEWQTACNDAWNRTRGGPEHLLGAVVSSDKDRFQLLVHVTEADEPDNIVAIRAVQGFSMPFISDDRLFIPISVDPSPGPTEAGSTGASPGSTQAGVHSLFGCLVHGTSISSLTGIQREGLRPAGAGRNERTHNHLAPFPPEDPRYRAGMRHDSEAYLYYHTYSTLRDHKCLLSHAGAVLTRSIIQFVYLTHIVGMGRGTAGNRKVTYFDWAFQGLKCVGYQGGRQSAILCPAVYGSAAWAPPFFLCPNDFCGVPCAPAPLCATSAGPCLPSSAWVLPRRGKVRAAPVLPVRPP